ncbi:bi-domain-containing oxidoreductase [Pseudonocardia humida]|uniref:Bi-domain-containing oxidoreductase n=1 Tax=Pseudonocardia humida TaxID=2800819 RepID=A0ABT0ZT16_9PSEU|nr:bi-domain-containing oxidoreductase [Pseudonocardia humida]MCO1653876.1 bi-domain-containing oxidoreductase [Pseudonocardia humida]
MKQVVQSVGDGNLRVVEVPSPTPAPTDVLVATRRSLLSSGTERAVRELASAGLLRKAKARPDLVRAVLKKARTDGISNTVQAVRTRLDDDMPLGYSAAGVVVIAGGAVPGTLVPGSRVATASAGHAEIQLVPGLLAVPIPDGVSDQAAAFGAVAAVALQGLRQADVAPGGTIVVVGLGLVGQLTVRMAVASGLDVVGVDLRGWTTELVTAAGGLGLVESGEDTTETIRARTRGRGADAVLITASTPSSDPVMSSCARLRDRGRIVVVGDVGLDLARTPFYEKEIELRFARSYGPGRYERSYEEFAVDYPVGHVRWTEGRNIEAFLDLVGRGRVTVDDLVTHVFPVDEAEKAYATVGSDPRALAVQFCYDLDPAARSERIVLGARSGPGGLGAGIIGAGNFAKATFLPALGRAGWTELAAVTSSGGLTARHLAEHHGIGIVCPDVDDLLTIDDVGTVFVLSRHDSHAQFVSKALRAGRNVFVEKPLALTHHELDEVVDALGAGEGQLWVGFNRRHSEAVHRTAAALPADGGPLVATYRVSAGRLPAAHWYKDRRQGGRLLGEVCHFVDVISWIVGAAPVRVTAMGSGGAEALLQENLVLTLAYGDGSLATVSYAEHGHPSTAKERLEILGRGHSITIDDYKRLTVDGKDVKMRNPDKGHVRNLERFHAVVRGEADGTADLRMSIATTATMLDAASSLMAEPTTTPPHLQRP